MSGVQRVIQAYSMDPPGARDLDDAVGAARTASGGWNVQVCIPDVPALVHTGDEADLEARRLGVTTYHQTGIRHPMLPPAIVDALSLSDKRAQPMILVTLNIGANMMATVQAVERIQGRIAACLTYRAADAIIDNRRHPLHRNIALLWELARLLHARRVKTTGAVFDMASGTMTNEEGQIVVLEGRRRHRSNMIVMEMMIMVNGALARHAQNKGLPVLYRNHRITGLANGSRTLATAELAKRENISLVDAVARIRAMSHVIGPAEMGTKSLGHHGLDLGSYLWASSPLRRYCDLTNLRALVGENNENAGENLAAHLTEIHRLLKTDAADHHGASNRRRHLQDILRGGETAIRMGVLLRALQENPDLRGENATRRAVAIMMEDKLSGEEIAILRDNTHLFGGDQAGQVQRWINENPARIMLLRRHEEGEIDPADDPTLDDGVNHKGALLELAAALRATVVFDPLDRTGQSHSPVFTSTVHWTDASKTLQASRLGMTAIGANNNAAKALITLVGQQIDIAPIKTDVSAIAPRTLLIEIAQKQGGIITIDPPVVTGPQQRLHYNVAARYENAGNVTAGKGGGWTKREAERTACADILMQLGSV